MNKKEIKETYGEASAFKPKRSKEKENQGTFWRNETARAFLRLLLDDPKIMILDQADCRSGSKERIRIRNLISDLSGDKIVLIATHVVSDIESYSKEILLMKNGRVVDKDYPEALRKKIAGKVS